MGVPQPCIGGESNPVVNLVMSSKLPMSQVWVGASSSPPTLLTLCSRVKMVPQLNISRVNDTTKLRCIIQPGIWIRRFHIVNVPQFKTAIARKKKGMPDSLRKASMRKFNLVIWTHNSEMSSDSNQAVEGRAHLVHPSLRPSLCECALYPSPPPTLIQGYGCAVKKRCQSALPNDTGEGCPLHWSTQCLSGGPVTAILLRSFATFDGSFPVHRRPHLRANHGGPYVGGAVSDNFATLMVNSLRGAFGHQSREVKAVKTTDSGTDSDADSGADSKA
ncbi:hypothetical protein C8F04DRAFT_1178834 [Mycena alexandri]|uniref:Uncharacterized protein n=1 Tax=Mycena alexandri TaxID=1745969 RepID=A0AAD6T4X5_9AGAR|nr:hypothetical protein C8F04DRAFT_1178834 [Mycena alexandri]